MRGSALIRHNVWLAFAAAVLSSVSLSSCASSPTKEEAEARFDSYMTAWIQRDIDEVWQLMSPRMRRSNNDKSAFSKFVEGQNIYFVDYERVSSNVEGDRAQVIADMVITDAARTETIEERQRCDLVFESGEWYVDDCRPLDLST